MCSASTVRVAATRFGASGSAALRNCVANGAITSSTTGRRISSASLRAVPRHGSAGLPASALLNNTRVDSASARGRLSPHCRHLRGSDGNHGGNATGTALGNTMKAAWILLIPHRNTDTTLLVGSNLARQGG